MGPFLAMAKQTKDPGFGSRYEGRTKRMINKDGSFNIIREGTGMHFADTYQYLIAMSWPRFLGLVVLVYCIVNCLFAFIYLGVGVEEISGPSSESLFLRFFKAFFFSAQTFTTVGYGTLAPKGVATGIVASAEALVGLMSFALATGLLWGRFSRPTSRILFSENALVKKEGDNFSLLFRMVNQRTNVLMNMHVDVLLSVVKKSGESFTRTYYTLQLETNHINFFPLNWTLVHKIDSSSPIFGWDESDWREAEAELLILVKGFDDSFSQEVLKRHSYRFDEVIWGARFVKAFHIDDDGDVIMDVNRIHDYEKHN